MTSPLFVENLDALKAELRLSGVPQGEDAEAILTRAVAAVRAGFYRRLGILKVNGLVALPFVANPTDDAGVRRLVARTCEIEWVRCFLLDLLPTFFTDSSGSALDEYNEGGTFRKSDPSTLDGLRTRCHELVSEMLDYLSGEEPLGQACGIEVWDGSSNNEACKPRLGESICWPKRAWAEECQAIGDDFTGLFGPGCC